MRENGFFKVSDDTATEIVGIPVNQNWWSRRYEYPWALQYATGKVADMGCGYTYRPFKDALAKMCGHVYAVDGNPKIYELNAAPGVEWVLADMTERIERIPVGSLDRVFCISVLEDVGEKVPLALMEFGRCLRPGGLCVLTFDVQYDMEKPLGPWPGVKIEKFWTAALDAGMWMREDADLDKAGALWNEEFNLCVFHVVLQKVSGD